MPAPSNLLLLLSVFLLLRLAETAYASPLDLATCLTAAGVRNITVNGGGPAFGRLLDSSIQNLRFAGPNLPKPAAVILPASKMDLRSSVLCCRRASIAIRIRSGGHSYEGLSYLAGHDTPFAVIDLANLNGVRVDRGSATAWLESGATLGEVYYNIASAGEELGLSAGSCPTVGSGGHIAGGGFGLLSRKFGLAADNVIDAVLVDADGRFLDRRSMGEDLFWAIRGGGGGAWGAVYAWRVRLVPVPPRVSCFVINRPGSARDVARLVDTWQHVAPRLPDEFYLSVFIGADLPDAARRGMSATFKGFYLGPATEAVTVINRRFPGLNISGSDLREMSWIESVVYFSGLEKGSTVRDLKDRALHGRNYFKAKSDYVRAHIPVEDLITAVDSLARQPKAYLILDPYGGAMDRIKTEELPFPHRGGNLYTIQYLIEWRREDDHKSMKYMNWIREFYESMGPFVSNGPRAAYVNYLDLDLGTSSAAAVNGSGGGHSDAVAEARVWGEPYFLGNYDRLVRTKTAVDPNNVFSNAQSVPPLAPDSKIADRVEEGGISGHSVI